MIPISSHKKSIAQELEQWVKKMRCSGSTGLGIESFGDIRVGVDPSDVEEGCASYDPIECEDVRKIVNSEININCKERVILKLENGDLIEGFFKAGLRHGLCVVSLSEGNVAEIRGNYKDGKLDGKAKITLKDRSTVDGFFKSGILHGFARYFDRKGRLSFVGNHKNGRPDGTCWKIIRGGGCVVGRVDSDGHLTGIRMAYIYPDYETALVGVFEDGVLRTGKEADICGYVEDEAGIKVPIFTEQKEILHVRNPRQAGEFGKGEVYHHLLT